MSTNTARAAPLVTGHLPDEADAVVCDLSAIPADQRAMHFAFARTVLFGGESGVQDVENGIVFELPPERLADVAAFLENERRCCRHLAFTLEIPPRDATLVLRVTGPGASDELRALAR